MCFLLYPTASNQYSSRYSQWKSNNDRLSWIVSLPKDSIISPIGTYTTKAPGIMLEHIAMQSKIGCSKTRKDVVSALNELIECKANVQKNDYCNEVSLHSGHFNKPYTTIEHALDPNSRDLGSRLALPRTRKRADSLNLRFFIKGEDWSRSVAGKPLHDCGKAALLQGIFNSQSPEHLLYTKHLAQLYTALSKCM